MSMSAGDNARVGGPRRLARFLAGSVLGFALVAYIAAVITGRVPAAQRISIPDLAVIVVGIAIVVVLLRPQMLDVVKVLEVGNFRLELREVQREQHIQRSELDDIRFVLGMLVSDSERKHLENLQTGKTSYRFSSTLPAELRRLRGVDLIRSKRGVGELPTNQTFDLSDFVELTDKGRSYLERSTVRSLGAGGPV